jgi:hypothetical protein
MTLIDLDALTNESKLPRIRIYGREIVVRPLSGAAAHRVAAVTSASGENGAAMLAALLEVVRMSCPDLTTEEVERLTLEQLTAVVQLSRNQVDEVEQMISEHTAKN